MTEKTIEERLEAMESSIKAVTDSQAPLQAYIDSKGETLPVFRCAHSGLYYPADYVKQWGVKYGIGLGSMPVSECLDTHYGFPIPKSQSVSNVTQIMHPVGVTRSQLDFVLVAKSDYEKNVPVLDIEDAFLQKRAGIILKKQLINPKSTVRSYAAELGINFNH